MTDLPANRHRGKKHAGMMFLFGGLEAVSRSLVHGDGFEDIDGLEELERRCRGLADLIAARIKEAR